MTVTAEEVRTTVEPPPDERPIERKKRTRKVKEPEVLAPSIEWGMLAAYFHPLFAGIFVQRGVDPPTPESTKSLCVAWGLVAEKYLPDLGGYELEVTAGLITLGYVAPLVKALMEPKPPTLPIQGPGNGKPAGN
jgi:hypothetical protein